MFRLMLNAHSRLHVPRESWFLMDLMDALPADRALSADEVERALEIMTGHERWKVFHVPTDRAAEALRALPSPYLRDVIDRVYRVASAKPRWGDKTPEYLSEMTRLADVFPTAQFIHVIRDCRDVCISLRQVGWHGRNVTKRAAHWRDTVADGRAQGQRLGPGRYLEVRYEDLVLNTRDALTRVTDFLGESFEEGMLNFHVAAGEIVGPRGAVIQTKVVRAPRSSDVQRWRTELSAYEVALIETVAGDVMDAVGQQRRFRGVGRAVTLGLQATFGVAERTLPLRRRFGIHFPELRQRL